MIRMYREGRRISVPREKNGFSEALNGFSHRSFPLTETLQKRHRLLVFFAVNTANENSIAMLRNSKVNRIHFLNCYVKSLGELAF